MPDFVKDILAGALSGTEDKTAERGLRRFAFPALFFLTAVLLCAAGAFLNDIPSRDVASRYAPMADAFADGSFAYAFHPRIPPLFPTFAGVIAAVAGCSGFAAAKAAAILFFLAGVFPLYALLKRVFSSRRTALLGVVFYLFCPNLSRYAFEGVRETGKCFAVFLLAWALVTVYQERSKLTPYLVLGLAAGIGGNIRAELIFFSGAAIFAASVLEFNRFKFAWRSLCCCGVTVLAYLPVLAVNFKYWGMAVPEIHLAKAFVLFAGKDASVMDATAVMMLACGAMLIFAFIVSRLEKYAAEAWTVAGLLTAALTICAVVRMYLVCGWADSDTLDFVHSMVKGLYLPFTGVAIIAMIMRLYFKKWKKEETILFLMILFHHLFVVLQIFLYDKTMYISDRYLITVAPLAFGWTAVFAEAVAGIFSRFSVKWTRVLVILLFASLMPVIIYSSLSPLLRKRFSPKDASVRDATLWIAETIDKNSKGIHKNSRPPHADKYRYVGNRVPRVLFRNDSKITAAAYLSGGELCVSSKNAQYVVLVDGEKKPRKLKKRMVLKAQKSFAGSDKTPSVKYRIYIVKPKKNAAGANKAREKIKRADIHE